MGAAVSTMPKVPGRVLAWTALFVALGASVAANVAYARPDWGPRLSAGTAPVLTVLAAALLERVPLGAARTWQRWLAWAGLSAVAAAAFITSYEHQYALLLKYGNPWLSAILLPVAVDGLIVLASVCLAVIAERRRELSTTGLDPLRVTAAVDTVADTTADIRTAASPDTSPSNNTDTTQVSGEIMSTKRQPPARRHTPSVAERVAKYARRYPDAPPAVIATKLGCAERTVRRHLAVLAAGQPADSDADTAPVNGTPVPDLVTTS